MFHRWNILKEKYKLSQMTKEIKAECKHCGEVMLLKLHWEKAYHFFSCKSCGRQNEIEIKHWEIKKQKLER